jgi:hypothetical protein
LVRSKVVLDEDGPVHDVEHAEREREEDAREAVNEDGPVAAPLVVPLLPTQPLAQRWSRRRHHRRRHHHHRRRAQLGRLRAAAVALVVARRAEAVVAAAQAAAGQRVRRRRRLIFLVDKNSDVD